MTHPQHWLDRKEMWKPCLIQNLEVQAVLDGYQPSLRSANCAEGTLTLVLIYICSCCYLNIDSTSFFFSYLQLLFTGTLSMFQGFYFDT